MPKRITKFSLRRKNLTEMQHVHEINMPKGAKIIHVGLEFGQPFLWAMYDEDVVERVTREFLTSRDDIEFPPGKLKYYGTYMVQQGHITEHVLEMV